VSTRAASAPRGARLEEKVRVFSPLAPVCPRTKPGDIVTSFLEMVTPPSFIHPPLVIPPPRAFLLVLPDQFLLPDHLKDRAKPGVEGRMLLSKFKELYHLWR
jgi:hypothetical protein